MPQPETYIGDGVYASFDGYQIILRTERQELSTTHWIALEPTVYFNLYHYAKSVFPQDK